MLDVVREREPGGPTETVIRVEGTFDGQAAARLALRLGELVTDGELPTDGELVIDFAHVEAFHDLGVALVARELADHAGVRVRGLARHQLRLLRYCGIDLGPEHQEADL